MMFMITSKKMSLIYIFLFYFLINGEDCSQIKPKYSGKVVNGEITTIEKHPYLAIILRKYKTNTFRDCLCGSSILNNNWILTAGHCVSNYQQDTSRLQVLTGSSKCYNTKTGTLVDVRRIIVHPQYIMGNKGFYYHAYNDIALMQLKGKLMFKNTVKPVQLVTPSMFNNGKLLQTVSDKCFGMGWGLQNEGVKSNPPDLLQAKLPLIDSNECADVFKSQKIVINASLSVCTLDRINGRDVCNGDSGGPLMCNDYQLGIVSGGKGCARKNMPNLWTRVDAYYSWIQKNIQTRKKRKDMPNNSCNISIVLYILLIFLIINI